MVSNLMSKQEKLKKILQGMESVLVAFSGGVDSTFLLKSAKQALGEKVLAVTAVSSTYPNSELISAKQIAKQLDCKHKIIMTRELQDKRFISNPVNRCYFCKKELFSKLIAIARSNNLKFVIDASNVCDKKDFRPGNKAKQELKVRSPLQEAGLRKNDIRNLSRKLKLPTWNKPSQACLASRIPYGRLITAEGLAKIAKAESFFRANGFKQMRLRDYGGLCRIEVEQDKIKNLIKKRNLFIEKLSRLGYNYITVDLKGYRSGSLNEPLKYTSEV